MPHGSHIQLHRSAVEGATPDVATMLEGEPAVNLADKKLYIKGATGELITLIGGVSAQHVAGSSGQIQFNADSGFSANPNFVINSSQDPPRIGIGTASPREALEVQGTILVSGVSAEGATFAGTVDLPTQYSTIGTDNARIQFNGPGGQIIINADTIDIPRKLRHHSDTDTLLQFDNDEITLTSGNTEVFNVASNGVIHMPIGISGGGATFNSDVVLTNSGDIALTIKGDTENSDENANPLIRLEQDGGVVSYNIGINGLSNNQFVGAQPNAFYIEAESSSGAANQLIQFATNNADVMTLNGDGNVGINTSVPRERLEVVGTVLAAGISADGATFGGNIIVNGGISAESGGGVQGRTGYFNHGEFTTGIILGTDIVHAGDTDTRIEFSDNVLDMQAGSQDPSFRVEANSKVTLGDVTTGANGTQLIVDDDNESVTINAAQGLLVSDEITHVGDTNTKIAFSTDNIQLRAGNTKFLESNATGVVHVPVGISGGGATFGINGITTSGHLNLAGDIVFEGSDSKRIMQNGQELMYMDNANGVVRISEFSLGVNQIIAHNEDADTRMQFKTDEIEMEAGGKVFLEAKGADGLVHAPFGVCGGGATFAGTLKGAGATFDELGVLGGATFQGQIAVAQEIVHFEDEHTGVAFSSDRVTLKAGDTNYQIIGANDCTNFGDTEVRAPALKDYAEKVHDNGAVNGVTLDFENGNVQIVTGTNSGSTSSPYAINLTNPPASGRAGTMTAIIINSTGFGQSGGGMFNPNIQFPGGVAPTLSTAPSHDVVSFLTTNEGATFFGFVGGLNFS